MIDRIRLYFWLLVVNICNIFCVPKDDSSLQYAYYFENLKGNGSLVWSNINKCINYKDVAGKILKDALAENEDFLFYVDENVHKGDEPLKIDEFTEASKILIVGKNDYIIFRDFKNVLVDDIHKEVTELQKELKGGYYMTEGQLLKKLDIYTKIKDKITLELDTYINTVKIVKRICLNKLEEDDVKQGYIKFKDPYIYKCSDRSIEDFFSKINLIHNNIESDSKIYNSLFYFLYFGGEIEVISGEGGDKKVEKMVNLNVKDTEGRIKKYNDLKNEKFHFYLDNKPITYNLIFPECKRHIDFCIEKQSMSIGHIIRLAIPNDFLDADKGYTAGLNFIFKLFNIDKSDLFVDNIKFSHGYYWIKIKKDKKLSIDKSPGYNYLNDFGAYHGYDDHDHNISKKKCCDCCCF